jgi:hypothetical protein
VDENGTVSQVRGRFGLTITVIAATQNCDDRPIASHGNRLGCHAFVAVALDDLEQLALVHVLVHVGCHGPSNCSSTMPRSTNSRKLKWPHAQVVRLRPDRRFI